jgi:hypothetical protein
MLTNLWRAPRHFSCLAVTRCFFVLLATNNLACCVQRARRYCLLVLVCNVARFLKFPRYGLVTTNCRRSTACFIYNSLFLGLQLDIFGKKKTHVPLGIWCRQLRRSFRWRSYFHALDLYPFAAMLCSNNGLHISPTLSVFFLWMSIMVQHSRHAWCHSRTPPFHTSVESELRVLWLEFRANSNVHSGEPWMESWVSGESVVKKMRCLASFRTDSFHCSK